MATPRATPSRLAPLPDVLAFTFLASLGTGTITNGVYFLTESALGYERPRNFALAAVFGAIYIATASSAAPAIRRAARDRDWLTTRRVLAASVVLVALACVLPFAGQGMSGGVTPAWTVWTLIVLFAVSSGVLWPVCEAYVSGGRHDTRLRSAMGRFNLSWSAATVVALWAMGPLVERWATQLLLGIGVAHVVALVALTRFPPEPSHRVHDDVVLPREARRHSARLLRQFRILLPISYLLTAGLLPQLPTALERLGTDPAWKPLIASVYLLARFVTFALYERWHGWHASRAMPIVGGAFLCAGFVAGVLAPMLPDPDVGRAVLIVSLPVFGFGAATVYTGAIFYAMEAGESDVDSGGAHEAFIGMGYTLGPLCGLASVFLAHRAGVSFEGTMAGVSVLVACLFGLGALAWSRRDPSEKL